MMIFTCSVSSALEWEAVGRKITNSLISLVELAPTFLEVAGIEKYPFIQGTSQLNSMYQPEQATRDWCLVEYRAGGVIRAFDSSATNH